MDAQDADTLRSWVRSEPVGSAAARRARIVLLSGKGLGPSAIAGEVGCSKQMVITWRERYRVDGLAGLRDAPRSGRPPTVDAAAVIRRTLEGPPHQLRAARWSTRLLAAELGISNAAVANVWRTWGVVPAAGGGVHLRSDPALDVAITAVAGLCVDPPVRVLALRIDLSGHPSGPAVPVAQRPGIGARITRIDPGVQPEPGGCDGLAAFLADLDEGARSGLGLLVETRVAALGDWARTRPGVSVYAVPAALSWERLARVACVLAGATTGGAASVAALRRALARHAEPQPFRWINSVATDLQ